MASAPTPGVGRRQEEVKAAKQVATLTVKGETHTLALNNIPIRERAAVRKATGLPLEHFFGGVQGNSDLVGLDSFQIMWWLARRADGEPNLTLEQVEAEWPEGLSDSDVELKVDDPEGDTPEA